MADMDRRKNDSKVHERLAVLETNNVNQSEDIKEILGEVKGISIFIHGVDTRLTKVETRQKIYLGLAGFGLSLMAGVATFKDRLTSFFGM